MNCAELSQLLLDYFDGALPGLIAAELRQHAADCACCRSLVETYGLTVRLSADVAQAEVPPGVAQRVRDAVRALAEGQ
ncbi:MAG: hypothetical protein FJ102_01315 [Deltaproteobacteria bacterium]|nr:hypothetical protein [Deltaproteobacteria bacterium]